MFQRLFSENPPVRSTNPPPPRHQPPPLPPRPSGATSPPGSPITQNPISPTRIPLQAPPPPPRPPTLLNQPQLILETTNGVSRSSSSSSLDQLSSRSPPIPPPLPPQHFRNNSPPPIPYRTNLPNSPYPQYNNARPRAHSGSLHVSPSASPAPDILDASLPPPQTSGLPPPPLPPNPEHARLIKHLHHLIQGYIQPSIQKTKEHQTEARQEREKLLTIEVQVEKELAEVDR